MIILTSGSNSAWSNCKNGKKMQIDSFRIKSCWWKWRVRMWLEEIDKPRIRFILQQTTRQSLTKTWCKDSAKYLKSKKSTNWILERVGHRQTLPIAFIKAIIAILWRSILREMKEWCFRLWMSKKVLWVMLSMVKNRVIDCSLQTYGTVVVTRKVAKIWLDSASNSLTMNIRRLWHLIDCQCPPLSTILLSRKIIKPRLNRASCTSLSRRSNRNRRLRSPNSIAKKHRLTRPIARSRCLKRN